MIEFIKRDNKIIFIYHYSDAFAQENDWVREILKDKNTVNFKKTFSFSHNHYIDLDDVNYDEDDFEKDVPKSVSFVFAELEGDYFKVINGVISDKINCYIHKDCEIDFEFFVADKNISIIKQIESITDLDIYIGGEFPNTIPYEVYLDLIKNFPNSYEKKKYSQARIAGILRNYFDGIIDAEKKYNSYINKKASRKANNLMKTFQESEVVKFKSILDKLEHLLQFETDFSEPQWQLEILDIILLLYPKYISVFKEVPVNADGIKQKSLDFLLIDANGNVDIIEIKRPFENCIMTKGLYRDNYIPLRELSGTVMQVEKYIYFLNRWGKKGETYLTTKI
jgi:hypothetical protein